MLWQQISTTGITGLYYYNIRLLSLNFQSYNRSVISVCSRTPDRGISPPPTDNAFKTTHYRFCLAWAWLILHCGLNPSLSIHLIVILVWNPLWWWFPAGEATHYNLIKHVFFSFFIPMLSVSSLKTGFHLWLLKVLRVSCLVTFTVQWRF